MPRVARASPHPDRAFPQAFRGFPRSARGQPPFACGCTQASCGSPLLARGWPLSLRRTPQSLKSGFAWAETFIMAHDFIPRRDCDFVNFSASFSARINATPVAFGLTPAMASDYAALNATLHSAFTRATQSITRTTPAVGAKNTARRNAERSLRQLARLIQATPGVSNEHKQALGLTVRDTQPSPVRRPVERPRVSAKLLFGSTVRITVQARKSLRRGKPQGVAGATILSYVGDRPPADPRKWMQTNTTRPRLDITFDHVQPGAVVWIAARWFNPRQQAGPMSEAVYTHMQCQTLRLGNDVLRLAA